MSTDDPSRLASPSSAQLGLVERLRQERRPTAWTRGVDTDYPTAWEPNLLAHEAAQEIERLRAEVKALRELWDEAETENDSLRVEAPTPALRRAAERSIVAWTVVRGGVWDPNGLMDEHMDELRKALGPNATMKPLDPLDVEEMWDQANADERADEVHHAFARLVERAHGIGPNV